MADKIVSINFDVMKQKTADAAKTAATTVKTKLSSAADSVGTMAKGRRDQALASLLNKGIELSQRQLSALERVRSRFS